LHFVLLLTNQDYSKLFKVNLYRVISVRIRDKKR